MVDEQDTGGWVETGDGVEWDVDGVIERDAEAAAGGLSIPGFFGSTLSPVLPLFKGSNL